MLRRLGFIVAVALCPLVLPPSAHAQNEIAITIDERPHLTAQGAVVISFRIACGPLPGVEEFREELAGAVQARTRAEAEGTVDGPVICDGLERVQTAHVSPFTDERFKRGPAGATVSVFVCQLLGDDQVCFHGSAQRRVIISGRAT